MPWQEYLVNTGVTQGSILVRTLFLLYVDDVLCSNVIYGCWWHYSLLQVWLGSSSLATTRYSHSTWIWSLRHCGLRQEVAYWFQCWKIELVLFDWSNNTGENGWVCFREKSSFKILKLFFFSKLYWVSFIISVAETTSKKIRSFIHFMKFLSPEVALQLYKSTIRHCMEYCYMEMLDNLQKQIFRTVGPSFTASLKHLAHCQNRASVSLFCRYYFVRCSS